MEFPHQLNASILQGRSNRMAATCLKSCVYYVVCMQWHHSAINGICRTCLCLWINTAFLADHAASSQIGRKQKHARPDLKALTLNEEDVTCVLCEAKIRFYLYENLMARMDC